jgi:hypothetical protein
MGIEKQVNEPFPTFTLTPNTWPRLLVAITEALSGYAVKYAYSE